MLFEAVAPNSGQTWKHEGSWRFKPSSECHRYNILLYCQDVVLGSVRSDSHHSDEVNKLRLRLIGWLRGWVTAAHSTAPSGVNCGHHTRSKQWQYLVKHWKPNNNENIFGRKILQLNHHYMNKLAYIYYGRTVFITVKKGHPCVPICAKKHWNCSMNKKHIFHLYIWQNLNVLLCCSKWICQELG